MGSLAILGFITFVLYSAPISGKLQYGQLYASFYGDEDFKCKRYDFDPRSAPSNDVHVHLRLRLDAYQAAVSWVESVSSTGFTGCVAISGPIAPGQTLTVYLTWIAFEPSDVSSSVGLVREESIISWTTGTKCIEICTDNTFNTTPLVFTTVVHTLPLKNIHDAASVWAEEVTNTNFTVCLREFKNFDGVHENIKLVDLRQVDLLKSRSKKAERSEPFRTKDFNLQKSDVKENVLALSSMPVSWPIPIYTGIKFENNDFPSDSTSYSFCKEICFPKPFYTIPRVVTTAAHDKNTIEPDHNAISEWVKSVSETTLTVCLKDIQRYDATHDPVTVNYMAIGHIDPCYHVSCGANKYCLVNQVDMTHACECRTCIGSSSPFSFSQPVCDTHNVTHNTRCELDRMICLGKTIASWHHNGACQSFVLERGRVTLRLNTTDVQCKTVYFSFGSFQSYEAKINVQTSINYFNNSGAFIHDAAVTWVESVTYQSFHVCALKAGRAERPTPDNGLTFVDYIAIQEPPAGAAAGQLPMPSKWWDETTCATVNFQNSRFVRAPYVFLTAQHTLLGQKHDAATVWAENVNASGFQACLREMQNFDGHHENITVNWIAYESLENATNLNSNQHIVDFPNDDPPKPAYDYAFCQDKKLGNSYSTAPTVIVSASHSSGPHSDNLIPQYNSIASWVESINSTYYRLCVKEIHKPNGYDPVKVTALIIGA